MTSNPFAFLNIANNILLCLTLQITYCFDIGSFSLTEVKFEMTGGYLFLYHISITTAKTARPVFKIDVNKTF